MLSSRGVNIDRADSAVALRLVGWGKLFSCHLGPTLVFKEVTLNYKMSPFTVGYMPSKIQTHLHHDFLFFYFRFGKIVGSNL